MILQGVKLTIQPLGVGYANRPKKGIYTEQHVPKTGWKLHKYGLKHALHSLDGHFR